MVLGSVDNHASKGKTALLETFLNYSFPETLQFHFYIADLGTNTVLNIHFGLLKKNKK